MHVKKQAYRYSEAAIVLGVSPAPSVAGSAWAYCL